MKLHLALALTLVLSACSAPQVEDARTAVHEAGEHLQRLRAVVVALCQEPAPEGCPELVDEFNAVQAAYAEINEAMP